MTAKFFGSSSRPLFGMYHAPTGPSVRGVGAVLCNPGPQEYRQSHFVYRKLALALAAEGVHVFRFDYYGTGDSSGESREGSLEQWATDVGTAVSELRDLAGVRRVALVGMRLGAVIAARAAAAGMAVSQLVLWDPVVSGADYLAELEELQHRILLGVHYPEDAWREPDELLGYAMPEAMRASLRSLDLRRESCGTPSQVRIVCAELRPEYVSLHGAIAATGVASMLQHVEDATLAGSDRISDTLLAIHVPTAIRDALAGRKG